jgi:hypothetical protein
LRRWDRHKKIKPVIINDRGDRRYLRSDIEALTTKNTPNVISSSNIQFESKYVLPRIKIHDDFNLAEGDRDKYGFLSLGNDLHDPLSDEVIASRSFVLAEAGFGKSRLLKEAARKVMESGGISDVIDLKLFTQSGNQSFMEYINNKHSFLAQSLSRENINILVCLDGLDEVKASDFDITVDRIKKFLTDNSTISVLISCRWYFCKKRWSDLYSLDLNVITLMPFDMDEIRDFLYKNGISEGEASELISKLSTKGRDLIISVPRYLELVVRIINQSGISAIKTLKRTDLFEKIIYYKLELEDSRLNEQRRDMFKSVLEKLALAMEIFQTNVITTEEFMTFLEDVNSSAAKALLKEDLLRIFYEKSLLVDNEKTIQFENTEFQEYLAAKHLLSLNQPFFNLYDLIVEEDLREIHPSWFATLSYLIELNPDFLEPLLVFGKTNHTGLVEDEQYHTLLTRFNLDSLDDDKKTAIFEHVFLYYQNVLNWISYEVGRNLSFYYTTEVDTLLKSYIEKKDFQSATEKCVQLGNVALVIGSLKRNGLIPQHDEGFWKSHLVDMIQIKEGNGVLQRRALEALEQFKDDSFIETIIELRNHNDRLVQESVISFCSTVNPNNPKSISLFLESLKSTFVTGNYQGLQMVTDKTGIIQILDSLISDKDLLKVFIDRDKSLISGYKSDKIIENITLVWDEEISQKLEEVILKAFERNTSYLAERSHFIVELSQLIDEKKPGFIYRVLDQAITSKELSHSLFDMQTLFSKLLKTNEIDLFIKSISRFDHGKRVALWTLQQIKNTERQDAIQIYESARDFFQQEYIEFETPKDNPQTVREDKTYENFKSKLEPEKGQFMMDVFDYFNDNFELITSRWTKEDKTRLEELITGTIFKFFDPREHNVKIKAMDGGAKSYEINSLIHPFGECIEICKKLKLDITPFRRKLAGYIPFAAYENTLFNLLDLLGNLTSEEFEDVLKVYEKKEGDLWKFNPESLIEVIKRKKDPKAKDVMKTIAEFSDFSISDRISALAALADFNEEEQYFINLFKKYKSSEPPFAEQANKFLIQNYQNDEAILWRFEMLEHKARKFITPEGFHEVGEFESELNEKSFASPLYTVDKTKYENNFLELLKLSFQLLDKDQKYMNYASYLWDVVYTYFDSRKVERSYLPLERLEDFVAKNGNKNGSNWFIGKIRDLRNSYLLFIGKPTSFAESVRIYNELKLISYLKLGTNEDLYQKVKKIITSNIQEYLYSEGASLVNLDEPAIQKNLQTEIEKSFLREKIKVIIIREAQAKDNTRCDFLLYYGWLGPILIELKLSDHGDIKGPQIRSKKSHIRFKQYITNNRAYKGILLVIDNISESKRTETVEEQFKKIQEAYSDISNSEVIWLKLEN